MKGFLVCAIALWASSLASGCVSLLDERGFTVYLSSPECEPGYGCGGDDGRTKTKRRVPCGIPIAEAFKVSVKRDFKAPPADSCQMSSDDVFCDSHYLPPPYKKVFVRLEYACAKEVCRLKLSRLRRGDDSDAFPGDLSTDDQEKFDALWTTLMTMSESCAE